MSTKTERHARAKAIEQSLKAQQNDIKIKARMIQACEDSIEEFEDPALVRLEAFIKELSIEINPSKVMQRYAATWLRSSKGLRAEMQKMLALEALNETLPPAKKRA